MLRRILLGLALLLASSPFCFGQGFSIGADLPINTALNTPGPISTISGALISLCAHPANAVPCTNKSTTYTDITLATACPTSKQLVLSGTNSCVANTDPYGNWRAWVAAGAYDMTVQFATGQSYGPFTITVAGSGGGGGGISAVNGTVNQITTTTSGGVVTVSFPASVIFPGTVTATGALNAPGNGATGTVALKNNAADGICYADINGGSDSNDGLSWGSAKLTVYGCLISLPGALAPIIGKGTVYFTDGTAANPTSTAGLWIMGTTDPNYSSPPAGWLKNPGGGVAVTIIGVAKGNYGTGPTAPKAVLTGGNSVDINHPCIWISGVNSQMSFQNIQCNFQGRPIVIGEDSNHSRAGVSDGGSSGLTFYNVGGYPNQVAGQGPGLDFVGGSFWASFSYCSFEGTDTVNTITNNDAAAMLFDGTGNDGIGEVYLDHIALVSGGIKINPGTVNPSVQMFEADHIESENVHAPALLWITGQMGAVGAHDIVANDSAGTACNGGVCAIRNDGTVADNVAVSGALLGSGIPSLQGPMIEVGGAFGLTYQPLITTSFLRQGLRGVIANHLIGTSDVSRRQFGPAAVRFANAALPPASYITIAGTTLTQNVADPTGATGATRLTATGPGEGVYIASQSGVATNVGDWFVAGAWVHSFTGNGYATSGNPLVIGLTSCTVTLTYGTVPGTGTAAVSYGGDGEWEWIWTAVKVATVTGSPCQPNINASADATHTLDIFGPVYYHVPAASAPSDNEMLEIANNLQSYDPSCVVGTTCNVSTETLNVAGGLGCAFKTVSSAYQLTARDCVVNVTGTTTITIPHALVNNHWSVFDSGVGTVTLQADTGSINGGGTVTLATLTGSPDIHCDGTNCWAALPAAGSGGSSIFASYQFGAAAAITGSANYVQLIGSAPLATGQTGSGSVGSPFVQTLSCPTCVFSPASVGTGQPVFGSANTQSVYSSPEWFDTTKQTGADMSVRVQNALAGCTFAANSHCYVDARGETSPVLSVNMGANLSGTAAVVILLPCQAITVNAAQIFAANDVRLEGCGITGSGTRFNASGSFPASTPLLTFGSVGTQFAGLFGEWFSLNCNNGPASCTAFLGYNLQEFSGLQHVNMLGTNNATATAALAEITNPAGGGHATFEDLALGAGGANDFILLLIQAATEYQFKRVTCNNTGKNTGLDCIDVQSIASANTFAFMQGIHMEGGTKTVEFNSHTGGTADGIDCTGVCTTVLAIDSGALPVTSEYSYGSGTNILVDASVSPTVTLTVASNPNGYGNYTNNSVMANSVTDTGMGTGGPFCVTETNGLFGNTGSACGSGSGGSGVINPASQFSAPYYSAAGSAQTLSGQAAPSAPNGVPYFWVETPAAGAPTVETFSLAGVVPRTVAGASDTILATDRAGREHYTDAAPIALTVPQAGTANFASNFVTMFDYTGNSLLTVTPTTSTINGVATQTLGQNDFCFLYSDNTNYQTDCVHGNGSAPIEVDTGAANAYVLTYPLIQSLTTGAYIYFTAAHANTGASTINVNGLGVKNLTKNGAAALISGDINTTAVYFAIYDGTEWQVQDPSANDFGTFLAHQWLGNNSASTAPATPSLIGGSDTGPNMYATDSGIANAYIIAPTPAITALTSGAWAWFVTANPNTGASTINVSGLGVKALDKKGATALVAGDILASPAAYLIVYDGTEWQLVNASTSSGGANNCSVSKSAAYYASTGTTVSCSSEADLSQYQFIADSGVANAYVLTLTVPLAGLTTGNFIWFNTTHPNTGASTVNVSGLGVKNITFAGANALRGGEILSGIQYMLQWDGTQWELLNPSVLYAGASPPACAGTPAGPGCFTEGTAATPVANVDDLHADSTQHAVEVNNNNTGEMPISRVTCVNVTPVTVAANVTTDQNLMSCTMAANLLNVVGRTIHVHAAGVYSTAAASTAQITAKAKLCTVSGCGSGTVITLVSMQTAALGAVSVTNNNWNLDFYSTTQTAGATAAFEAHGQFVIDPGAASTAADAIYADTNATTVSSIDTTGGLFLQITYAYSAGSTSNSVSQRQGIAEVLN
jgi:hypothetical protein